MKSLGWDQAGPLGEMGKAGLAWDRIQRVGDILKVHPIAWKSLKGVSKKSGGTYIFKTSLRLPCGEGPGGEELESLCRSQGSDGDVS